MGRSHPGGEDITDNKKEEAGAIDEWDLICGYDTGLYHYPDNKTIIFEMSYLIGHPSYAIIPSLVPGMRDCI